MNRLRHEKSPYLQQHRDNPVHWYAWSDEAFEAARELNRPVFLSIGYSTCYWCHVMEQDSFENDEVASALNAAFVCIKVDREERPDIDQIYMDAVVGISGHGGWPMSVFLTPDKKPFFGGTFFPKQQFIPLLHKIGEVWQNDHQSILTSAERIFTFLNKQSPPGVGTVDVKSAFGDALEYFRRSFDVELGGFGQAPKFPQPANLEFLLRLARRTGEEAPSAMATKTLDELCRGGIYDHIGGGFHRYATDRSWLVPHFEKMLYDNAQLAAVLVEAYQATKKKHYLIRARETLDYCLRDMKLPEGGFASAEDAGEVGSEGEFYVWELSELEHSLSSEELDQLRELFEITEQGNFEKGTNILALKRNLSFESLEDPEFQKIREKLLRLRDVRDRPLRDTKILTAWNGLMLTALARGYAVTGDDRFLHAATGAAEFIRKSLTSGTRLLRRYCDGESKYPGFLEDYSYLIQGLLALYEVSSALSYYEWSKELQQTQDEFFWDAERGGYYFSPSDLTELIVRKKDFNDGAVPSGNSVSALNLLKLFQLSGDTKYLDRYRSLLEAMAPHVSKYPAAYPKLLCALDYELDKFQSAVVSASSENEWREAERKILQEYLPNTVVVKAQKNGPLLLEDKLQPEFSVYVCDSNGCEAPEKNMDAVLAKLTKPVRMALTS